MNTTMANEEYRAFPIRSLLVFFGVRDLVYPVTAKEVYELAGWLSYSNEEVPRTVDDHLDWVKPVLLEQYPALGGINCLNPPKREDLVDIFGEDIVLSRLAKATYDDREIA